MAAQTNNPSFIFSYFGENAILVLTIPPIILIQINQTNRRFIMKKQILIGIKLFLLMFLLLGLAACECEFKDITTDGLPTGTVGRAYNANINIETENCSVDRQRTWIISGELPPGIALSDNGNISGTPALAGLYTFTVAVEVCFETESGNCHEKSKGFLIEVVDPNP